MSDQNPTPSVSSDASGAPTHELKVWPQFFAPLESDKKTFEYRRHDRDFRVGDTLVLREWEPTLIMQTEASSGATTPRPFGYTGRVCHRRVTYIAHDEDGKIIPLGYCIMSIEPLASRASLSSGTPEPSGCGGIGSGGYPPRASDKPACQRCHGAGVITIACPGPEPTPSVGESAAKRCATHEEWEREYREWLAAGRPGGRQGRPIAPPVEACEACGGAVFPAELRPAPWVAGNFCHCSKEPKREIVSPPIAELSNGSQSECPHGTRTAAHCLTCTSAALADALAAGRELSARLTVLEREREEIERVILPPFGAELPHEARCDRITHILRATPGGRR